MKKQIKRLKLSPETIRTLTDSELSDVEGAGCRGTTGTESLSVYCYPTAGCYTQWASCPFGSCLTC